MWPWPFILPPAPTKSPPAITNARPDYPDEARRWLAERLDLRPGRQVVDIAAGTGKLTRALVAAGAKVVAVEPVAGMREQLAAVLPDVEVLDGVAEAIPLDDAAG